ncbi:MAG: hypothetical protein H7321_06430 [Bacteroidia bacterium]|nr:hypothetical protein [Bacteroidia bacterium]
MNKQIFITVALVTSITLSIIIYSCKKKDPMHGSNSDPSSVSYITPSVIPTASSWAHTNEQIRYISYSMAILAGDTNYLNSTTHNNFVTAVENVIPTDDDETSFSDLISLSPTLFKYVINKIPGVDLGDAHWHTSIYFSPGMASYSHKPITNPGYNRDFLEFFQFNLKTYHTILRLPDIKIELANPLRFGKPVIVCPNEIDTSGVIEYPRVGFYYNKTTSLMDTVMYNDEVEFDAETRFYVWIVDRETDHDVTGTNNGGGCSGDNAPVTNDEHCDIDCGENINSSANDCSPYKVRHLWISKISLTEDEKRLCSPDADWRESRSNGKYEIAWSCFIVKGSRKIEETGGKLKNKWDRDQLVLSKVKRNCNKTTLGGTQTDKTTLPTQYKREWTGDFNYLALPKLKGFPLLSSDFNPLRDTIYIMIWEYDPVVSRSKSVTVYYGPGKSHQLFYATNKNEGPCGDKKSLYTFEPDSYNNFHKIIRITPSMWPNSGLRKTDTYSFPGYTTSYNYGANFDLTFDD